MGFGGARCGLGKGALGFGWGGFGAGWGGVADVGADGDVVDGDDVTVDAVVDAAGEIVASRGLCWRVRIGGRRRRG